VTTSESASGAGLLDRSAERAALDGLVEDVERGRSRVMVLRGEPGIGKTALMDYLLLAAADCQFLRATGVESEMELAFAGLHQLCNPLISQLDDLPIPQRDALGTALGMRAGNPPDPFLVGLATLTLLCAAADSQPLICLVEDAQWLDAASAQAIAFVARRLAVEHLGIAISVRDAAHEDLLEGLPEIQVPGLERPEADALLTFAVPGKFDPRVREQLLAEARGNPLALLELPRGLAAGELTFGLWHSGTETLASRIERGFVRRMKSLPSSSQRVLLTAAAEPTGDRSLLSRATEILGISPAAIAAAEQADLLEVRSRVVFRHPLVRSAAYRYASPEDRQAVHRALAAVTDPDRDPDRRAWHRAQGSDVPDEDVAFDLERSADRALARGGLAAAAAFMEQSVTLTVDSQRRAERALEAADAKSRAGAFTDALSLLEDAEERPLDPLRRARVDLLRAQITFATQHGNQALPMLLEAARRLEPLDRELALDTYLDAFAAAMFAGRFASGPGALDVARAAQGALQFDLSRKGDLLLKAVATMFIDGHGAAKALAREAMSAYRSDQLSLDEGLRSMWLANALTVDMLDFESWVAVNTRHLQIARDAGALGALPLAINSHAYVALFREGVSAAVPLVNEAKAVTEIAGGTLAPFGAVSVAAWQGREAEATDAIDRMLEDAVSCREGIGVGLAQWGRAVLCNALGRYPDALVAAREAAAHPAELGAVNWALIEVVEAAERTNQHDVALRALQQLSERAALGTDWGRGFEAYARALVSDGDEADALYLQAIESLSAAAPPAYLPRAHLVYGEWLRRSGRRREARAHLRAAFDCFTVMGFEAFAERARHELAATGEAVRKRTVETSVELTPQEAHVARLAGEGLTNPEIGAKLFLSHRTVEWHLGKVFNKLGIVARRDLLQALQREQLSASTRS
jgi:DNA-binding CsgD family transcriptional regulator/tetratricopeptide (TPR) repeat protein